MKLLHINSSPRKEKSRTLEISQHFLNNLKKVDNEIIIETLNLFEEDLPEVTGTDASSKLKVMANQELDSSAEKSWSSLTKISEHFLSFDYYVIACPMWNFSIPYKLKHYIDIIMQPDLMFRFTADGVEGLAQNKKMFCITTRGSDYGEASPFHQYDHQESYLRSIFGLAGIFDISFINTQPLDYDPNLTNVKMEEAKQKVSKLSL